MLKFSGINILSKTPEKSFEFYKGLGLTVTEEAEDGSEYYGATFDLGNGATLWIWRDNGNDKDVNGRVTSQIVIGCEDMQKTYDDLNAKEYPITEPELMFYGGMEMNLIDPDGNRILFLD
jgi:predicted enzyme related to lactoylglutathione lyase